MPTSLADKALAVARRSVLLLGCAAMLSVVARCAAAKGSAAATPDTCVKCHALLPAPLNAPVAGMKQDIHAAKGLSCVDCHGGDATAMDETSMAPEKGFRGKPKHEDIPEFCGRCHADEAYMRRFSPRLPTDQLDQYWTSVHGQRLRRGDQKVATCVSCHGVHGILPPDQARSPVYPANVPATCGHCHSNPQYMAAYKIPTDQEEKYKRSVHANLLLVQRDLSAPACNDCHGNHGAFPPGVNSIAEVCGQCHVNNAAFFIKSPHKPTFDKLGLPECVTCHSNHEIHRASDDMLGGAPGTVCRRCHEPGSAGYAGAVKMRQGIEKLKSVMTATETMLARARTMGMEVSEEEYTYRQDVRPRLVKVRTDTHLGDPSAVLRAVQEGIKSAAASEASARSSLAEAQARRRHLLVPLGLIVIVMILLYAKLRQLERRP
ncbi:MAG: cytochrome c3 family protein [Candidatus Binatia bacterium]